MGVNIQTTAPNRYEPTASPPKGANKFTRVFRASIHPAPSSPIPRSRSLTAHLVLSSPMHFVGAAAYILPPSPVLLLLLPLLPAYEHVLFRVRNVPMICSRRSFAPLPSLLSRSRRFVALNFFLFPLLSYLSLLSLFLIPLSSREDAR